MTKYTLKVSGFMMLKLDTIRTGEERKRKGLKECAAQLAVDQLMDC